MKKGVVSELVSLFSAPAIVPIVASLFFPSFAWSYSIGITGHSGNVNTNGGAICTECHSGGVAPTVQLNGPSSVVAGTDNTFILTMSGGQNNLAGMNISASSGALTATVSGMVADGGELKHSQPFNVGNTTASWEFNYKAPATKSTVTATIYAAVLSANGDGNTTGDNAKATAISFQITASQRLLPPVADIAGGPFFIKPGDTLQLDASGSTTSNGSITRYLWDFGDGSAFEASPDPSISHVYNSEGPYTVTLAATDEKGLTGAVATSVTVSANSGTAQGEALYNQHCFACHGPGGTGNTAIAIVGVTVDQINNALATVGDMQGVSVTPAEIQLIADFLASGGGGEPPPRPTDGPGLFGMFCSACHGVDGRGGNYKGVTGAPFPMINDAITNITLMQSINLSVQETQLVADFLTAGGGGAIPTDGTGLYAVYCSVCHGDGGHGGKFKAVTGASSQMISGALANITWMQPLSLDPTQVQLIAGYLAAGGEPPIASDNKGLYDTFCAVCHGAGGHGGKFKAVTGAGTEIIDDAITNQAWMNGLHVSTTQRAQIANYLGAGGEPPLPGNGSGLYQVFCQVCHGAGGHGGKFKAVTGAPNAMISDAMVEQPWMDDLQMSPAQQQLIAGYLTNGGSGPLPTDGSGLYGVFCSVCHGNDGRGGKYKVVTGASSSFVNRALNNVNLMSSLSLTSTQVSSVANFLTAGGGGSKPTTGSGLYHVYCETCHGPNGSGGPEENIRGSSQGSINSALSGISAMRHLAPYLSTSGSSSDTALIAGFLGGSSGGN